MANLWAFGDSFVYGEDVEPDETFPHYMALDLDLFCINMGRRGNNNPTIVNDILRKKSYFKKDDFILVSLTTPHRNEQKHLYNVARDFANNGYITLVDYCKQIRTIENCLEGFNYKITQAFNPVFGYDYKLDPYIEPNNFIEWGKPNNTLVDIISYNWLENNKHHIFFGNHESKLYNADTFPKKNFMKNNKHPSKVGHRLIADKLLQYIKYDNSN